jgi:hypothetical protein
MLILERGIMSVTFIVCVHPGGVSHVVCDVAMDCEGT